MTQAIDQFRQDNRLKNMNKIFDLETIFYDKKRY